MLKMQMDKCSFNANGQVYQQMIMANDAQIILNNVCTIMKTIFTNK